MTENKETDNEFTEDLTEFTESLRRLIEIMNKLKSEFHIPVREDVIDYIKENVEE